MNLCMKALDVHLSSLGLSAPVKYAYLKLCTNHKLFSEFYIFKPDLSEEWGVSPKSIERYFSHFEKHRLFGRVYKNGSEVDKTGNALYGKLTPPNAVFLIPELPSVSYCEARDILARGLPQNNVDHEILRHFQLKQDTYKKQLEEPTSDKAKLAELANCLGVVIGILEHVIIKAENQIKVSHE